MIYWKCCLLNLLICSCLVSFAQSKENKIYLDINVEKGNSLSLTFTDSVYSIQSIRLVTVTNNKSLHEEINSKLPLLLYSKTVNINPYVLLPGDSIKIKCANGLMSVTTLRFDAETETRNAELSFFEKLCSSNIGLHLDLYFNSITQYSFKNAKEYSYTLNHKIFESYFKSLEFLNNYKLSYHISERIYNENQAILKYNFINNLLLPVYNSRFIDKIAYQGYSKQMDSLKNQFSDSSILYNFYYRYALYNYNKYLCSESNHIAPDSLFSYLYNSANRNFSQGIRDYLLYDLMKRVMYQDKNIFAQNFQQFNRDCRNSIFKKSISKIYENDIPLAKSLVFDLSDQFLNSSKRKYNLSDIIHSKDSLVYIDFWASWCVPCQEEMPYSLDLQKKYKDKPVKFIYISMDELVTDWLNRSGHYSFMNDKNSFLLTTNFTSNFAKSYKLNSIPRYMLYNKSGEIISSNAPRPSDKELKLLFDKYLN